MNRGRLPYAACVTTNEPERQSSEHRKSAPILILIGLGKLVKASLLIAVGIGALDLLHKNVTDTIAQWLRELHADPDNKFIHSVLERLPAMTPAQLEQLSVGTFLYAALFLAEGFGLLMRKRWAEYLTVASTAVFLPLEVYEMTRHLTLVRGAVFVINIAIVAYLIARLRSRMDEPRHGH